MLSMKKTLNLLRRQINKWTSTEAIGLDISTCLINFVKLYILTREIDQ